jgi:CubicO group peptidase (beta-lactamase class C family)
MGQAERVVGDEIWSEMDWSKVEQALCEASVDPTLTGADLLAAKKRAVFPGAVLLVGRGGKIVYHGAFGSRSLQPEVTPMERDTVFDIASLTKALFTTTLTMIAVDLGLLPLDRKLSHIFQTFSTLGKERMTVRHLLAHCSGYPAHAPLYKLVHQADRAERAGIMWSRGAVELIYNEVFRAKLENLPGKVTKYSDLGFILLGNALEVTFGGGGNYLDKLVQKYILKPLQLQSTGYIDLYKMRRRGIQPLTEIIAPTAECAWRGKILCGEVHDDNAYVMGGVAAHAGIFSTAADLHLIAAELINCYQGRGGLVKPEVVREFWRHDETVPGSTWALGWDMPNADRSGKESGGKERSSAGRYFSPQAVGHLGYTGCSIWIEPEKEIDVILLTNRVHPSVENTMIREFRPLIHDLVLEALG